MKLKINPILDNISEDDIRNLFDESFKHLGIKPGGEIPTDFYNIRETFCHLLFRELITNIQLRERFLK